MEHVLIVVVLGILGLMLGSFSGATVWRLRARQLAEDKKDGEPIDENELKLLKKLNKKSFATDRSRCLHCGHQLAWYDLLPLVSWLALRGKCRYCRVAIGWFEPLIEAAMAAFFIVSYLYWPYALSDLFHVTLLVLWLVSGVGLGILLSYDAKWFLLPNRVMFPVIGIAAFSAFLHIVFVPQPIDAIISVVFSCAVLSGLYFLLYIVSRGAWIGFGDIKLGLALGLLLADWRLALLALFFANFVGTMIVLPGLLMGKVSRTSRIPFGPMLIVGWFIAGLWGSALIDWYISVPLGL